jgi:hypothetical protein
VSSLPLPLPLLPLPLLLQLLLSLPLLLGGAGVVVLTRPCGVSVCDVVLQSVCFAPSKISISATTLLEMGGISLPALLLLAEAQLHAMYRALVVTRTTRTQKLTMQCRVVFLPMNSIMVALPCIPTKAPLIAASSRGSSLNAVCL